MIDAQLWIKKYFIEFSNSSSIFDEMMGKKLNILSSSLNHIRKFELMLKEIIIEKNNKK